MPQGVEQSLKNEPSTLKPDIEDGPAQKSHRRAMDCPQHARQRRFPRNWGSGGNATSAFQEHSDRRGPGKPFPVPHGGCPEDWGFDIARPRQRIALLGRKKARKFLAFLWSQKRLSRSLPYIILYQVLVSLIRENDRLSTDK